MWLDKRNGDALPWLLEEDPQNPGVRYFALRDLLGRPAATRRANGTAGDHA